MPREGTLLGTGRASAVPAIMAGLLLAMALLLGGATREGQLLNAAVRLLALPVMMMAIWRLARASRPRELTLPLALLAAVVATPLFQLVSLPPMFWELLPGRAEYAEAYRLALTPAPWAPIGLNPDGAWNAALALLPAAAMFLVTLTLNERSRSRLMALASVIAIAALLLGAAQVLDGSHSPLRFYETTNASAAVGFFSNRNHQASLLLAAMPLITYLLLAWSERPDVHRLAALVMGGGLFLLLAVGAAMSESRAGVLLAPPVGLACLLLVLHRTPMGLSRRTLLLSGAILLVLAVAAGAVILRLMPDLAASIVTDVRAKALPVVASEAMRHMPFGSGLGTFDEIYRAQERPETLTNAFLNHAHDDYIEVWLETGILGLGLVTLFFVWFGRLAARLWRSRDPRQDMARAGTILVGMLLAHSLVDYPLRTAALSTLFAFACGVMIPTVGQEAEPRSGRRLAAGGRALPRRSRQIPVRR